MKGKVVIVTGGAGGIGAEVCRAFAHQGVSVAVADPRRSPTWWCSYATTARHISTGRPY
ncbi:MAG: SDR family NAD(P)-dependent oxidoreductase, partial [Chloroflexi bacterium]|nr:SDR family NAD(P)-dependent oxidoreductase [Chloroflexota bacterium]